MSDAPAPSQPQNELPEQDARTRERLLAAAGRRKEDPDYIARLLEGVEEYRRLLKEQEEVRGKPPK